MRPKRWTTESRVLFALALVAGEAHSQQGAPLTLEWKAPPACPARDDVRRRVEELLGGPVETRLGRPLRASGTVIPDGERFELRLRTEDGGLQGERVLHGASCQEVTSAAALIVALAVDPKAVAATEAQAATPPAAGVPAATASPAAAPPVAPPPPSLVPPPDHESGASVPVTFGVDADVAADLGSLPGFAVGPSLGGALGLGRVRFGLAATYFAPRFANAPAVTGKGTRGADVSLVVAGLSGCYLLAPGAVEVGACAELEGGARFASGSGFDTSNDATTPWLAAGGFVDLAVPLAGPVALRARVGAVAPFGRSPVRFTEKTGDVAQIETLYHPSPVCGRAALGVGAAFR